MICRVLVADWVESLFLCIYLFVSNLVQVWHAVGNETWCNVLKTMKTPRTKSPCHNHQGVTKGSWGSCNGISGPHTLVIIVGEEVQTRYNVMFLTRQPTIQQWRSRCLHYFCSSGVFQVRGWRSCRMSPGIRGRIRSIPQQARCLQLQRP